jgi:hypothetical protein
MDTKIGSVSLEQKATEQAKVRLKSEAVIFVIFCETLPLVRIRVHSWLNSYNPELDGRR